MDKHPPGAPYDRIIATCSVEIVPWAWVVQTRPGGVIVTPWGPPMANDHLLRLEVGSGSAVGTIVDSVGFMRLRAQRWHVTDEPDDFPDIAACSSTDLDPHEVLWLLASDSWASISDGQVRQAGARKLWDEAVAAYQWWIKLDCPDRQRFHLTVIRERQWVWPDDPANTITTLA